MWEISHLHYRIAQTELLHDISLTVPTGARFGIIGPNGSGKTTLLRHLYGDLPAGDAVHFDGRPVGDYPPRELARKLAVLTQFATDTEGELSVEQSVLMGRYPHTDRFLGYRQHDYDIARHHMDITGTLPLAARTLGTLSGGERQRAQIARAGTQEPDSIILDEPTNHLDVRFKVELMQLLQAFPGTIVMTLHDLTLAYRYCDTVAVLVGGRLIACGAPTEIMTAGLLTDVFGVPFRIIESDGKRYPVLA